MVNSNPVHSAFSSADCRLPRQTNSGPGHIGPPLRPLAHPSKLACWRSCRTQEYFSCVLSWKQAETILTASLVVAIDQRHLLASVGHLMSGKMQQPLDFAVATFGT